MHYKSFNREPIASFPGPTYSLAGPDLPCGSGPSRLGPTIAVRLTASDVKLDVDHHNTVKLPGNIVQGTIIYTVQWIVASFPGPTIAVRLTASDEKLGVDHYNTVKLPGNIVQGIIIYIVLGFTIHGWSPRTTKYSTLVNDISPPFSAVGHH